MRHTIIRPLRPYLHVARIKDAHVGHHHAPYWHLVLLYYFWLYTSTTPSKTIYIIRQRLVIKTTQIEYCVYIFVLLSLLLLYTISVFVVAIVNIMRVCCATVYVDGARRGPTIIINHRRLL